uniref:HMG-Y-related protein A n=1 Tax=Noccaea caerulescens TaxID=107243 RepID=A0A1J3J6L0_NOCCA
MASDLHHASATDQHSSDSQSQQQPAFSLPPYPQMIMEAIESLNDKNGSNKTTIAKHIESTQHALPPSHTTLLNYHLNHMKQSGQIVIVKNNYMKPDPNAPPKRGRGRPPKPKPPVDSSHVAIPAPSVSPPRPRGRPPKSKESPSEQPPSSSIQPKSKEPSVSGRPRGRPPKKQKTDSETVKADAPPTVQPNGERRGRGRPPKVKPAMVPVGC